MRQLSLVLFAVLVRVPIASAQQVTAAQDGSTQMMAEQGLRAYREGRFADANRRFEQVDRGIGGTPYNDAEPSEALVAVRASYQCAWALSAMAQGPLPRDSVHPARAALSCDSAHQAVAALLLGDERHAALRTGGARFPEPFGRRELSMAARAWAASVTAGSFPPSVSLEDAVGAIQSRSASEHGLTTACGPARGFPVAPEGRDWPADAVIPAVPPFGAHTPDAIALVNCAWPAAADPYGLVGLSDTPTETYFVVRDDSGIQVVGRFDGLPEVACGTGVIRGIRAHRVLQTRTGALYAVFWEEGYQDELQTSIRERVVLCDPRRARCATVDVGGQEASDDGEGSEEHSEWSSRLSIRRDRVILSRHRSMPAELRRFVRGVPLDTFFGIAAAPAAAAPCALQVADPDGQTNLRTEPSTTSAVARSLPNGTSVTVEESRGRWARLRAPHAGWVWRDHLREVCPSPPTASASR